MYRGRVLPVGYHTTFLVLFLFFVTCSAKNLPQCDNPPSCGNINISYPFRLRGDPPYCGDQNYELSCENNTTMLSLDSGKYYVQAINRHKKTIQVVDVGVQKNNCSSLPLHQLRLQYPFSFIYPYYVNGRDIILMSCENPVNSSLVVDTSPCINGVYTSNSPFSYVLLTHGYSNDVSDVEDLCSIDMIVKSSSPTICKGNCSYSDIHKMLVYGFELSWSDIYCEECKGRGYCNITEDYTEVVGCIDFSYPCGFWCILFYGFLDFCYYAAGWILYYPCWIIEQMDGTQDLCYRVGPHLAYLNLNINPSYIDILVYFTAPIVIVAASVFLVKFLCGMPCVVAFLIYKWRRRHLSMYDTVEDFLRNHNNLMPIWYSFSDIKKMTKGFKDKLGEGGYGTVYKGKLRSGRVVAIKILGKSKANGQEFINEVATIGRIHHVNVVQLIGFCAERSKRALVYEFMPNGSLEKYIFSKEENITLGCEKMFEIAVGVARGIEYLHRGCDMQILHFDIKPHNILLDESFTPKVSDFGLAKLYPTENSIVSLTVARGTMGYMAPELFYKNIGGVSYKADVYSFGMLLMEMVGRRRNLNTFVEHLSQIYFPAWVYDQCSEGKDIEIGDATEEGRQIAKKMAIVALWCIQMKPSDRPSMTKVVEMLEGEVKSIQVPPKPFQSPREMQQEDAEIITNLTGLPTPTSGCTDSISLLEHAN